MFIMLYKHVSFITCYSCLCEKHEMEAIFGSSYEFLLPRFVDDIIRPRDTRKRIRAELELLRKEWFCHRGSIATYFCS